MPYPWQTAAPPSGSRGRRPWDRPDPAELPDGAEEDQSEESWFTLPNALRIGGGVAGGVVGAFAGPLGAAGLGAAGAAGGEALAEMLEVRRHQRQELNPYQIATQGVIGAIPLGKIGSIATGAVKGGLLGGGATVAGSLAETGELPDLETAGKGALYGGVFGGAAAGVINRFARPRGPRPVGAGQTSAAVEGAIPPPKGSPYRSVVSPRFQSFDPPPTRFPDAGEMAMAYQPNLPGSVQAGGRRMGPFDQGSNLPPLPEGFDELNRILAGDDPEVLARSQSGDNPSLERPLLPSGLDAEPPALGQTPRQPWESLPADEPSAPLDRPEGPFPSMTRPLVPSGLDANPPSITAPHPLDFLGPADERGYRKVPFQVADQDAQRAMLEGADYSNPELRNVPLKDLLATQDTVTGDVVQDYMGQPAGRLEELPPGLHGRMGEAPGLPTVVEGPDGRLYLAGGTHKTAAAMGRGETEVQALHYGRKQAPPPTDLPPELAAAIEPQEPPVMSSRGGPQPAPPGREGHFKLPETHVPDAEYEAIQKSFGLEPTPNQIAERRGSDVGPPPGSADRRAARTAPGPVLDASGREIAPQQPAVGDRPAGPWDQNVQTPVEPPPPAPKAVQTPSAAPSRPGPRMAEVDPEAVGVDAKTYQFKGGGDASGVTDRLSAVESWDPIAGEASPLIVHERTNGQQYVVDGHQRLGLAKRLKAAGRSGAPDKLRAIVLRESEGVTVPQARRVGAMLNLQQGTGTATDVAKVLRESPLTSLERARIPKDQTSGAKLRMGEDLSKLGDDAFLRVVNGQVHSNPARNEAFGAIVGRNISDPAEQVAALQQLAKAAPDNAYQAEQFVKAIKADGFERGVQTNLFGEQEVASSLADPISRIMAAARRTLQSEKSALGNALRNEDRLAGRGNVLNREANQAGFESAGTLDRLLDTYGHTAGPVREELKRVAAAVERGEITPAAAANQIIAAVERERGNLGGAARPGVQPRVPANDGPGGQALAEPPAAAEPPAPVAAKPPIPEIPELAAEGDVPVRGNRTPEDVLADIVRRSETPHEPTPEERILFDSFVRENGGVPPPREKIVGAGSTAKARPDLPVATPAEVPGILQQLAETLNQDNKPLVDKLPPLALQSENAATGAVSKAEKEAAGQGNILDFDKAKNDALNKQTHDAVMDLLEEKVLGKRKVDRGDYKTQRERIADVQDARAQARLRDEENFQASQATADQTTDLPPELASLDELQTRHEVRNPEKASQIASSMKRVGWKGRPILVVKNGDKQIAWTGTHRLEAAKQAGLKPGDVPRVEVDGAKLAAAGYDVDELTKLGKKARIAALEKSGQPEAAALLREEQGAKVARERRGPSSRDAGTNPRAQGKNPRSMQRASELLDEGRIDEAEHMMGQEIEARIKAALKHGTGGKNDGGSTVVGGLLPFDPDTFRRLVAKHPESAWRATSTAIGGATGWYLDEDHPGRGLILGMMAGAAAGGVPKLVRALQTAEIKTRVEGKGPKGVEPVRVARDPKKDIGLFELMGGSPERTIPDQFEKARPAFEKFLKALHEEHARTKEIIPQKRVQAFRDRHMTSVIADIRKDAKLLAADKNNPQPYKAKYITAFANRLAGHRTIGQRVFQTLTKGKLPADFIERRVGSVVYYAGTGFGVDTALQNVTQPILASAHVPYKFIAQAYKDLATNPAAKRMVEGALLPLEKPADAIELTLGPFGRKARAFSNSKLGKAVDPQKLLRMTDQKNREVVYYAARKYAESRGVEEAGADKWARQVMRKTQTEPGALGTNPFHAGPVAGSLRPFTKYPTAFTEHVIDLVKQAAEGKNLGGAARLGGTLVGLAALGNATGIDLEDLLVSGGRPLGFDISHPGRSLERLVTGQATPASRGVFDLLAHLSGSADHNLTEDAKELAIPRYARKLADSYRHFRDEGTGPHVTRGPGGKIRDVTTPAETVLNLLGLKTTRQTERRHALTDFYDKATHEKESYEGVRRTAYEDLGRAIDDHDDVKAGEAIRRIGSAQAVRQFLKERRLLPEERFFKTLPPKLRQQLRAQFEQTKDTAPGAR